jgi:hypothetical protein
MRFLMRIFFFLVLLAGVALGFGYPLAIEKLAVRDLGMWHAYDNATGYQPVDVPLRAGDAPVRVSVELVTVGQPNLAGNGAVLTLTADVGGRTVLAEPLTFEGAAPRETNPQTEERAYRAVAGVIGEVEDATYTFTFGPGDAEDVSVSSAELVLQSEPIAADRRIQSAGFMLTAIGFIGFVLALRRRGGGTPSNPNSQPPARRWGRGGGNT